MRPQLTALLWAMFLLGAAEAQHCPSGDNDTQPFLSFTQPVVQRVVRSEDGLAPLYNFARAFLKVVQPNPLPEDIVSKAWKNEPQNIQQLARYEAGYVVCLILALLYLLLMPIVGGLLVWKYFHSWNAQSSDIQSSDPSSMSQCYYKNIGVSGCLILITILLLTGVILAFTANSRTYANMRPGLRHLDTNVGIIQDNLHSIPEKLKTIMDQYNIPNAEISKAINEANDTVGATIFMSFSSDFQRVLGHLSLTVRDAVDTIDNLQIVQTTRAAMQDRQRLLQNGLQLLQTQLDTLKECTVCDVPDSSNLETDADYNQIPSVQDKLDSMPPKPVFEGLVAQSNGTFYGIPQFCSNQMAPALTGLLLVLTEIQESLRNASQSFPSLWSLTEAVSDLRTIIQRYEGAIDFYDYIRWGVSVTVCTVTLLMALLLVTAISLGLPVLFNPKVYSLYPNMGLERITLCLFKVSMILNCAFSWVSIILVFVTLFFGGNAHTLGCRSFTSGQIFTFLDQQGNLFSSLSQGHQSVNIHPNTYAVYQGCGKGRSMFHSMDINQVFDLEDFLNSTKYMENFSKTTKSISVDMTGVKLLPDSGKQGIQAFRNVGLDTINYNLLISLLSTRVVKRNLTALAVELDEKAQLDDNAAIKEDLQEEAEKTRDLHRLVMQQAADAVKMNESVGDLRNINQTYKTNIDKTLSGFNVTEGAMQVQVPYIVSNMSQCTKQKAERSLLHYLGWVRHSILHEAMGCNWLARSVDNVYTAMCLNVIDPWNAFWLCLGWCCASSVLGLVLSVYVVTRLRHIPPPVLAGKDMFILPEKKPGEQNHQPEKDKTNLYNIMLDELSDDMSFKAHQMKGKHDNT